MHAAKAAEQRSSQVCSVQGCGTQMAIALGTHAACFACLAAAAPAAAAAAAGGHQALGVLRSTRSSEPHSPRALQRQGRHAHHLFKGGHALVAQAHALELLADGPQQQVAVGQGLHELAQGVKVLQGVEALHQHLAVLGLRMWWAGRARRVQEHLQSRTQGGACVAGAGPRTWPPGLAAPPAGQQPQICLFCWSGQEETAALFLFFLTRASAGCNRTR